MYDQNFRNQAVKECVNGQALAATARKYGISSTALRAWVNEYKERMSKISGTQYEAEKEENSPDMPTKHSVVELKSISVNIDGHDITMSKKDVIKLMEIFYQFDK